MDQKSAESFRFNTTTNSTSSQDEKITIIISDLAASESEKEESEGENLGDKKEVVYTETEPCQTWTRDATQLLIALHNEFGPKLGRSSRFKTKKQMWHAIQTEMDYQHYKFTPVQIENRWKTLQRAIQRSEEKKNKSRRMKEMPREITESLVFPELRLGPTQKKLKEAESMQKSLQVEESIREVVAPSVIPEFISVQNSVDFSDEDKRKTFVKFENVIPKVKVALDSPTPTTTQSVPKTLEIIDKVGDLAQEIRDMRTSRESDNRKKLKAYRERTLEMRRKNDLMEKFINSMQN